MSIKLGRIKIIEDIDNGNFFTFQQDKVLYYSIANEKWGYIVFTLPSKYQKSFASNGYNSDVMIKLFDEVVEDFYFISFADENYETQLIEYVGSISKDSVMEIYNEGKLEKDYRYSFSNRNSKH